MREVVIIITVARTNNQIIIHNSIQILHNGIIMPMAYNLMRYEIPIHSKIFYKEIIIYWFQINDLIN